MPFIVSVIHLTLSKSATRKIKRGHRVSVRYGKGASTGAGRNNETRVAPVGLGQLGLEQQLELPILLPAPVEKKEAANRGGLLVCSTQPDSYDQCEPG